MFEAIYFLRILTVSFFAQKTIDVVAPLLSSKRSWIVRRAGIQLVTSIASILPIVDR